MGNQKVFDLDIETIIYCYECKIYYNKLNTDDVKFHDKLHNKNIKLTGIKVDKNIYKEKSKFMYGKKHVTGFVILKKRNNQFFIFEKYFKDLNSQIKLMAFLTKKIPNLIKKNQ